MTLPDGRTIDMFLVILISVAAWSCSDPPIRFNAKARESYNQPMRPPETVSLTGTFAFANETGTELLALEPSVTPHLYSAAVCGDSRRFRVHYVRTQSGRLETSHRQVADNFGNEPGDVFQPEGGTAAPNETCYLATDSMVLRIIAARRTLDRTTCRGAEAASLVRLASREVLNCWHLAAMEGGVQFVPVHFANVDTSALAAVALVQDSVLLFYALPGQYGGPGESIWRVDDDGVFDPDAIRLLFAARLPQGHAVAFVWAGAEGESDRLVVADSTGHAQSAVVAYRYWSPP